MKKKCVAKAEGGNRLVGGLFVCRATLGAKLIVKDLIGFGLD